MADANLSRKALNGPGVRLIRQLAKLGLAQVGDLSHQDLPLWALPQAL